jgi:hypothetical protein
MYCIKIEKEALHQCDQKSVVVNYTPISDDRPTNLAIHH